MEFNYPEWLEQELQPKEGVCRICSGVAAFVEGHGWLEVCRVCESGLEAFKSDRKLLSRALDLVTEAAVRTSGFWGYDSGNPIDWKEET